MHASRTALIGYSGFIGGYLNAHLSVTDRYNSKNIEEISGKSFDTLICAGVPSVKWLANKEPEQDKDSINRIANALSDVKSERVILISTVDVFGNPRGKSESSPIDTENLLPYGLHRWQFENFVREHFPHSTVLRLPAMFGPGLKKNALFDMLHNNQTEKVARQGIFQWYDVRRLPNDIQSAAGLPLVHLVTQPVSMQTIIEKFFPENAQTGHDYPAPHYDLYTEYAARFGGSGSYISDAAETLVRLGEWIGIEKRRLKDSAA